MDKMHPAWQLEDIRYLLFECLEPRDLARLARTCMALFGLATDKLWETIESVTTLLCPLPRNYRARERRLRVEDLDRLDFYAAKIKNLYLESKRVDKVIRLPPKFNPEKNAYKHLKQWGEVWKEIAELRPQSRYLHNLRRLRINNVAEELLIPFVGIAGANLVHLYIKYIHNPEPESLVQKFLGELRDTPKLEYLMVRDGEPDLVPTKLIQQAPLKHLRLDPRISYGIKNYRLRPEIIEKSTLKHLSLGLCPEWYTPGLDQALQKKCFPALKTLWLSLATITNSGGKVCSSSCKNRGVHSWVCTTIYPDKRSPVVFLEALNNPELSLLNIKFPHEVTGPMFFDVIEAAKSSCRLRNLTELALAPGNAVNDWRSSRYRQIPAIQPAELREGLKMLLPLPHLKLLRLSVAPNFLDVLDFDLYKSIADGLPVLGKLWLSHVEFGITSSYGVQAQYERTPLHHLAAFCSMLPSLVDVEFGPVDALKWEETPRTEWACPGVKSVKIAQWTIHVSNMLGGDIRTRAGVSRDFLHLGVRTYFPNSDLAKKEFNPDFIFFDTEN
jgi:hypothetical protein